MNTSLTATFKKKKIICCKARFLNRLPIYEYLVTRLVPVKIVRCVCNLARTVFYIAPQNQSNNSRPYKAHTDLSHYALYQSAFTPMNMNEMKLYNETKS